MGVFPHEGWIKQMSIQPSVGHPALAGLFPRRDVRQLTAHVEVKAASAIIANFVDLDIAKTETTA